MKEYLAIILSFLIGISAHHEVHLVPAHKICPDVTPEHNILLPDPHDCSVFYKCENGTAIPQSCPPGLEWCQILQNCTLPILANCTLGHTVVTYSHEELSTYHPYSTTENPTSVSGPVISGNTCPKDGTVLPHTKDCRKYYKCVNGTPKSKDCKNGTLFSTWLGTCTDPEIANCINGGSQTNKTCPVKDAKRSYPYDCNKYYECINNKVETKQCPSGMEFNEWFNGCYPPKLAYCFTYTTVSPTTHPTTINTPSAVENWTGSPTEPTSSEGGPTGTGSPTEPTSIEGGPTGTESPTEPTSSEGGPTGTGSPTEPTSSEGGPTGTGSPTEPTSSEGGPTGTGSPTEPTSIEGGPTGTESPTEPTSSEGGPTGTGSPTEPTSIEGGPTGTGSPTEPTSSEGGPTGTGSPTEPTSSEGVPTGTGSPTEPTSSEGGPTGTGSPTEPTSIEGGPTGTESPTEPTSSEGGPTGTGSPTEPTSSEGGPTGTGSPTEPTSSEGGPTGTGSPTEPTSIEGGPTGTESPTEPTSSEGGPTGTGSPTEPTSIEGGPTGTGSPTEPTSSEGGPTGTGSPTEPTSSEGVPTGTGSPTEPTSSEDGPTGTGSPTEPTSIEGGPTGTESPTEPTSSEGGPTGTGSPTEPTSSEGGPTTQTIHNPLCPVPGLQYPSFTKCNGYMICNSKRQLVEVICDPPTSNYNCETKKCENITHCCSPRTDPPTSTSSTTIKPSPSPSPEDDICPKDGATLPNLIDCTLYYICRNNTPVSESCPPAQEYSCWDQKCEAPKDSNCIKNTQPGQTCKNDTQLPNILDCNKYYKCENGKVVLKHCPSGLYYNKWFNECVTTKTLSHCTTEEQTMIPPKENVCPFDGAKLPNPMNCTTYFVCINNVPQLETCPAGQEYSCWDQQCEFSSESHCITDSHQGESCSINGLLLPNIVNCSSYYICKNGSVYSEKCPSDKEFNSWFKKCLEPKEAYCHSSTTSSSTPTITTSHTTISPSPIDICPVEGAKLPNPVDCNSYFICLNNTPISQKCPNGQEYSCWDQRCEEPEGATCINQGNQEGHHCTINGELLPNIADCKSYLACVNYKVAMKDCALGTIYDQWHKKCISNNLEICITYPTVSPSTPTLPTSPTTNPTNPTNPDPVYEVCPIENALLPNPIDCTTYYECIHGTPVLQNCPNGNIYSCWDQKCELDTEATCVSEGAQNGNNCSINGTRITDVTNCNKFYECINGIIYLQRCPKGEEFNSAFQKCYKPILAHCHKQSTVSQPDTTPSSATKLTPSQASDICPSEGALLPNPVNCSTYYKCINGTPTPELCADGYEYSCWNQECEPAADAQCINDGNQPGVSCKINGQKIQNPYDCHSYYECVKGKVVLQKCRLNWYYNKWFKLCVPFAILAHCAPSGIPSIPATSPSPTPPISLNYNCPIDGALLPNPLDCSGYYKCENNMPTPQTCPSGQEYSCWDQQCETASNAQCINDGVQLGKNCSRNGVQLQNLESCFSYYLCNNGIVVINFCFPGFQYDKWYQKCVHGNLAQCKTFPVITPTSPTEPTISTPSIIYDICPDEGALLPNPIDCTSFYRCVNGTPTTDRCSDGMKYSCWDQKCELDANADCITSPQLDANCTINGLRLPNVANCSSYLECHNGKAIMKYCPPGYEFNDRFQDCYSPDRAHCSIYSTITPPTGTTPTSITKPTTNDICPTEGSLLPNPVNCSTYFKCINGTPTPELCADDYEYSCWDQQCEPAGQAQCIAVGTPPGTPCKKNGQKMPYPSSCHNYYECIKHVQTLQTCPNNTYYNKWFGLCVIKSLAHCNETTTIKPTPTSSTPALPLTGVDTCPHNNEVLPNPVDCSTYHKCKKNKPNLQNCPKGQKYSAWDQQCKKESEVECINVGSPKGKNCSRDGVRIQNLESCTSYFECKNGIVQECYCFIGFEFNRWYQSCELSLFSNCYTYPTIAPPATTTTSTTTVPSLTSTVTYPFAMCTENGAKVPDVTNCNKYYRCKKLSTVLHNCPSGYNYDCWKQNCVKAKQAECVTKPQDWEGKRCTKQGQTVPDPTNCNNYYICYKHDKKIRKMSCPNLQSYSVWEGKCQYSLLAKCANKIV